MPILDWLNKKDALKTASKVPYRLLKPNKDLSYGDQSLGNMVIKGDNLDTLKALLPYYKGQVKCIYIDPPYNSRQDFEHYNDNLEHSMWLDMIYPRLELLRELLTEDGSIWISIDDDEQAYLKVIADEVLGRKNFVNNVIWQKKFSPQNDAKWLSDSHDYIVCYAKNKDLWHPNLLPRSDDMDSRYKNPDNDPRGPWSSSDLTAQEPFSYGLYTIVGPTGKNFKAGNNRHWIYAESKFKELVKDSRIWFGENNTNKPRLKKFLAEVQEGAVAKTIWLRDEVGDNQESKREIKAFFEKDIFSTPKPERLIERVITLATNPRDLVLDSFLGSGTTAAVAQKMGRRYIGIEMGAHAITHCVPRLKKVIDGTDKGGISEAQNWQGGGGFTFYELGPAIFDAQGNINRDIDFKTLAFHVWFTETKTPMQKYSHSPLLGVCEDTAYYLLYNGILGDKSVSGGNVLTAKLLSKLPKHSGKKIIYGEACRLSLERLNAENIIFKQTPYDIKAR